MLFRSAFRLPNLQSLQHRSGFQVIHRCRGPCCQTCEPKVRLPEIERSRELTPVPDCRISRLFLCVQGLSSPDQSKLRVWLCDLRLVPAGERGPTCSPPEHHSKCTLLSQGTSPLPAEDQGATGAPPQCGNYFGPADQQQYNYNVRLRISDRKTPSQPTEPLPNQHSGACQ